MELTEYSIAQRSGLYVVVYVLYDVLQFDDGLIKTTNLSTTEQVIEQHMTTDGVLLKWLLQS